MKIAVLGAGGWGTTLAILLHRNGHNVTLWEFNPEYAATLEEYRENFYYLPKIIIPKDIKISNDLEASIHDKNIILITTPTQFIRNNLKSLKSYKFKDEIFVSASKGIENESLLMVSDMIMDIFDHAKKDKIVSLSGPSHAEEVSRRVPTAVVSASNNHKTAEHVQKIFSNSYFRVYSSSDLIGTEIGGALKNVIAIAAGISDGAQFGDNTKAALMTRGINEIMKLGLKLKAKKETFFGLSGIGDLIVTCESRHSRNRFVGEQIGSGKKLSVILKEMKMVAEGVATTKSAFELSKRHKIDMPIVEEVYAILFEDRSPHQATKNLMMRNLKPETD
ncbi:MAG: NAD(P)H-dependent glycerol-3-phosphate dehydrogenase [Ignavibacteriae bacterium]|nr:NAD(P)H-dependent glycerol-3-phosphate dehydrogenase [Ignavibacteriota bacterium]